VWIRIRVEVKSWMWMRIRIEVKSWMRIGIKVIRIRISAYGGGEITVWKISAVSLLLSNVSKTGREI
jgi:hypothetical protein